MFSDHISYQAMRQPHAVAVSLPDTEVTYKTFEANINTVAHHLRPLIEPGSKVAVVIERLYLHWLVVLALARLGHVSISLRRLGRDARIRLLAPDAVVTEDPTWTPAGVAAHLLSGRWVAQALSAPDPGRVPERPRPQDPARIISSSGTTGVPKLMLFSHEAIIRRVEKDVFGQIGRFDSRALVTLGLGTFGGFGVPLRTWLFGGALCLIEPTPRNLLERQVTGLVISPAGLRGLLDTWPTDFPRIPNLTITVGGSAVPHDLTTQARLKMAIDVLVGYGSTEACAVAMATASLKDKDPTAAGILLPWVELEVVDEHDNPLPAGEQGQIRIRADAGIDRYLDDPEASARVFRDGWFYPGDLGSVSEGVLRIAGRADDLMNFGGNKVLPEPVEQKLAGCRGVNDVVVFSTRGAGGIEEPWCGVVVGDDFDKEQFNRMARRSLGDNVKLLRLKEIPRNEMGKVERVRLRERARRAMERG